MCRHVIERTSTMPSARHEAWCRVGKEPCNCPKKQRTTATRWYNKTRFGKSWGSFPLITITHQGVTSKLRGDCSQSTQGKKREFYLFGLRGLMATLGMPPCYKSVV